MPPGCVDNPAPRHTATRTTPLLEKQLGQTVGKRKDPHVSTPPEVACILIAVQIGLAALAGIGLAGAGAAVLRVRRHHHPQPA